MNDKEFMAEVLKRHGLTDKPVKFDGEWVYPSEYRYVERGDISRQGAWIGYAEVNRPIPYLIYTPCTLPPKPTAEDIKRLTPYGKVITVADEPDLESVPYVSCQLIAPLMEHRNGITPFDKFHGLRYGVTIKDAPVVEYWRGTINGGFVKSVDGRITEAINSPEWLIGKEVIGRACYKIPEAEYLAAIKPVASYGNGSKLCDDCGQIEAACKCKPDAVRTCEHDWQGLECAKCGQPKPEQVKEIEQLPDFHMWDNPSEVVDAINRLNKAVNELRKGKV